MSRGEVSEKNLITIFLFDEAHKLFGWDDSCFLLVIVDIAENIVNVEDNTISLVKNKKLWEEKIYTLSDGFELRRFHRNRVVWYKACKTEFA